MADSPGFPVRSKVSGGKNARSVNKLPKKLAPLEDAPNATLLSSTMPVSKSITHKKELVEALRKVNPASVNTAPGIFWDVEGNLKTSTIDDSEVKQQMLIVENGVNYSIKRYNDLRVANDRLTNVLKTKLDELENQKKSFEGLDSMKNAKTEEGQHIDNLKKEISKVELNIRDKQHYLRKLEHMLNRLKSNQLKFDAHMTGMEETMKNIQKDGAEVRLMRRGLDAGHAKATLVLEETKQRLATARKDREVMLEQRKVEYKNARLLEDWLKQRERMKIELGIELRGDLTMEEEKFLKDQIDQKEERTRILQRESEASVKKLHSMEEAFTKLKQVTGVKNVEEMHEKFSNQKSNKLQLELEVKDAEQRLATVKKAYAKQETIFQELKSSGSGIAELNRDNINKLEEAYSDAKNEQKFIRADLERISTVLLGLHQGSQGLSQRTQPYLVLAEGGVFELTQVGEEASPWTETVDALTTSEHVLTKMMEAIVGDGSGPGGNFEDNEEDNESTFSKESRSLETQEEAPDFTNNVRIRSKKYHRDLDAEDERDLEGFKDKDDNGVDLLIPGVLAEVEEDENDVLMPTNGPRDISMINQGDDNAKVPSRLAMKKVSKDISLDAKRKKEMEIRRKRLLDRMEGVNRGGPDDAKIGMTATYRAQIAAGERLCVDKKPPTLPDGVTLRDDPMKKTIAFLNSMPNLK